LTVLRTKPLIIDRNITCWNSTNYYYWFIQLICS